MLPHFLWIVAVFQLENLYLVIPLLRMYKFQLCFLFSVLCQSLPRLLVCGPFCILFSFPARVYPIFVFFLVRPFFLPFWFSVYSLSGREEFWHVLYGFFPFLCALFCMLDKCTLYLFYFLYSSLCRFFNTGFYVSVCFLSVFWCNLRLYKSLTGSSWSKCDFYIYMYFPFLHRCTFSVLFPENSILYTSSLWSVSHSYRFSDMFISIFTIKHYNNVKCMELL